MNTSYFQTQTAATWNQAARVKRLDNSKQFTSGRRGGLKTRGVDPSPAERPFRGLEASRQVHISFIFACDAYTSKVGTCKLTESDVVSVHHVQIWGFRWF